VSEPTEAELRAFFGPRANYYVAQWNGTARRRYNLAAFLCSGLWLPYRRLYRHAAVLWGIVIGLGLLEAVGSAFGLPGIPQILDRLITFAVALTCAGLANAWYLARARDAIATVREKALPPEEHLAQVAEAGGTRPWHSVGFAVAFVAAFVAIVFVASFVLEMMRLE
jgi:hypothetical protein